MPPQDPEQSPKAARVPQRTRRRTRAPAKPARPRFALALLALVGIGAILWVLVFGASGSPAGQGRETSDADTRERPPTTRRKPKIRIAGHVQTREGTPIRGATVFVLPKKRPGTDRDAADHEVTDADGRWSLRTRTVVDCWIGVVAAGHRTAWLDGDTVDPTVQMFLIVEPADTITVTLRDPEGAPLAGQGVMLDPWPNSGAFYFLPGPKARLKEQYRVTNARGEARFSRGDDGPVTVTPDAPGWYPESGPVWMPDTRGELSFTMRRKAGVALDLRDATGEQPLSGLVTVEFFDPQEGTTVASFTASTSEPGRLELGRCVPPGRYGILVQMEEHAPWLRPAETIPAGDDAHVLALRLRPELPAGTLRMELEGNTARMPAGTRRRAPLVYLRRTDGLWSARGWRPGAPERASGAYRRLALKLAPGTYDVLIADVLSGRAALEQGVRVPSGSPHTLKVAMRPGQRGQLPALGEGRQVARRLLVADAEGRRLPVYGATPGAGVRARREIDVLGRALSGSTLFLGPYPLDEFTLTLRRGDGSETKQTFR
ncbi:MAG: carboxypeptidase-like regulatory domain-containing protein [Planctomycetota bacterium]|nr:carboxypeptidase-like regulatory domain-containing protein [Planctomycetota bacterium]